MVPVNGQQGWGGEEGRKRPSVRTGPSSCLGPLPDAKQSNALLILITEMILIHTGARATLPPSRVGPSREGEGRREVTRRGAPWRTNTPLPALCRSSTSSSTTSSLLKATFPEGPFHLSVFNYVKWIPWEKEKWWWWWALTEGEVKERERKGVAGRSHFLCQIHNSVSSRVRFICFFFFCWDGFSFSVLNKFTWICVLCFQDKCSECGGEGGLKQQQFKDLVKLIYDWKVIIVNDNV